VHGAVIGEGVEMVRLVEPAQVGEVEAAHGHDYSTAAPRAPAIAPSDPRLARLARAAAQR
jgi:hypothetical protein